MLFFIILSFHSCDCLKFLYQGKNLCWATSLLPLPLLPHLSTPAGPLLQPPEQGGGDLGHERMEQELSSWAPLPGMAVLLITLTIDRGVRLRGDR